MRFETSSRPTRLADLILLVGDCGIRMSPDDAFLNVIEQPTGFSPEVLRDGEILLECQQFALNSDP